MPERPEGSNDQIGGKGRIAALQTGQRIPPPADFFTKTKEKEVSQDINAR